MPTEITHDSPPGHRSSSVSELAESIADLAQANAATQPCVFVRTPCRAVSYGSLRSAPFSGFAEGFFSALDLDLFGETPLTFYRHPPFSNDIDALADDWHVVGDDLDRAFRETAAQLLSELRRGITERQEVLFDADTLQSE